MKKPKRSTKKPRSQPRPRKLDIPDLRARLEELESTLHAIRAGEVDALVVNGPKGDQVYSLKGAEQPYREFIERMGEGAVTLDHEGAILYCNKRFAEMIKQPLQKVISKNILHFVAHDDRKTVSSMFASDQTVSANIFLHGHKNRLLPVRMAISTLQAGGAAARAVVITDLTEQQERKALRDALNRLKTSQAELQKQYQEVQAVRTALEEANLAKDEFLAALSHELRTPLTPVLLTANAMSVDPSLPPELRMDAEMIRRNVELESRLIDDLLDLTRITRGKLQIVSKSTDLHDVLFSVLEICRPDAAAKRLTFDTQLAARFHHASGDAVRLQQVFWNLVRNAVKFTPNSGQITIATRNIPHHNGRKTPDLQITISDTGIGIDKKALTRIFDAFEQGSSEINRRFGGLGLGLTISKRLVDLHKGKISVSSRGLSKGSTFQVTLPTTTPAPAASTTGPARALPQFRSLRILLVEDHDDTRRNMARLLTALNHSVVAANSAASALNQAAAEPFDIVISDIGLPDQSGLVLMRKLREKHGLRGICLSGYGMEDDIAKSLAAGFSEHLTKPINLDRLKSALDSISQSTPIS